MLQGVKEEEVPGNRNDIVLDPRVTHIHVSLLLNRRKVAGGDQRSSWLLPIYGCRASGESLGVRPLQVEARRLPIYEEF